MDVIYTIWLRNVKRYLRSKSRIVGSLGMPLFFLLVMGFGLNSLVQVGGSGGGYIGFIVPGIVAMSVLFTSMFSGIQVIWDKQFGFLKEILVSPASRFSIMAGKVLGSSTIAVFEGLIVLILGPLVGAQITLTKVVLCIVIMFFMSFILVSLGLIMSMLMKTFEGFQSVMNLIIMPMFFLSGALFPINQMPGWMTPIVKINPATYGVDLLRLVLVGANNNNPLFDVVVLLFFTVVTMSLSVRAFSIGD